MSEDNSKLIELYAKNISHHSHNVITEKPYPLNKKIGMSARADIFIDLSNAFHGSVDLFDYGIRDFNWIEVKAFLSSLKDIFL